MPGQQRKQVTKKTRRRPPSEVGKTAGFFDTGLIGLMRLDPKEPELNRAYAAFERRTGKGKKTMSFEEIRKEVSRGRGGRTKTASVFWGAWADEAAHLTECGP